MQSEFTINDHWLSPYKKPAGGCTCGQGFTISWQNGPLGKGEDRREPNGAFVEDIIRAARDRILFYENTGFGCPENKEAVNHLNKAMYILEERTKSRENAGIEGTHELRAGVDG